MASVDRQTVFHTTKVRTALRKDGSWIRQTDKTPQDQLCKSPEAVKPDHLSSVESSPSPASALNRATPQTPVQQSPAPLSPTPLSPTSGQGTPTSPWWRQRNGSSYVLSAMKRTEDYAEGSSEGSSGLTQTDAAKKPETTKYAEVALAEEPADSAMTPDLHTPAAKTPEIPVISPVTLTPEAYTPAAKASVVKTSEPETSETPVTRVETPVVKTPAAKAPVVKTPAPEITVPEGKADAQKVTSTEVETSVVKRASPEEESFSPPVYISRSARRSITSSVAKALCAFCNTPVEGNVKITVSDPPIRCHAHCFKCAMCSKPLGDMKSSMFHHDGRIHCERCFDHIFFH